MTKLTSMVAVLIAVAALAVTPAHANWITHAELAASCNNFTLTFYGGGFGPGETVSINWQVVSLQGGLRVQQNGTAVMTDGGVANPVLTITLPWSAGPLCTHLTLLTPLQDDGQGSRFDWIGSTNGFGGADAFQFTGTSDFDCNCNPPVTLLCRTPGFWGTHAGTEKSGSTNITQAVINKAPGGLLVCGQTVTVTSLNNIHSALEAECVSVKGEQKLQLARQLTAAALNCVMSNGGKDCVGVPLGPKFAECNALCVGGGPAPTLQACIDTLDCFNNGGNMLSNGMCQYGTCNGDGVTACSDDASCGLDSAGSPMRCVLTPDNCHDRLLVNPDNGLNFEPPGPAGSAKACNDANKNKCDIFSCGK